MNPERIVPQEYVTEHEFERWMKATSESLGRIENLQRAANSKTAANSEAIAVILRRLDTIEREDAAIESAVVSVQKDGCNQLKQHAAVVQAIGGGATPTAYADTDVGLRLPHPSQWSRKAKVATGVSVGVALWPALTEMAKLLYTLVQFIGQHGTR
jgi:hypothetical protein